MTFRLSYTQSFYDDLDRVLDFQFERYPALADRTVVAIRKALQILEDFPLMGRRASQEDPLLRELVVPFGSTGYIVLFKVMNEQSVVILAIRHQREDDYH
jgi:plasmid stabilization system protein ParE